MKDEKIGVGLIGTGFARSAQAPAFSVCEWAELRAACSWRLENTQRVAAEFNIKYACENYEEMLALDDVPLIIISAPPHLHYPITLDALDAGKHVICEKPMAMNALEAREMTEAAESLPDQLSIIDHELRFNPTWRRLKELVDDGFLGDLYHINITIASGFRHSALRPWNWWSKKSAGGGLLGALGSHSIDAVRWLFGEIDSVCGMVETAVPERKDPISGDMRPNETDDYCSFLMKLNPHDKGRRAGPAYGAVTLSALFTSGGKNHIGVVGSKGTLVLDGEETLSGALGYNHSFEDLSLGDRALEISILP